MDKKTKIEKLLEKYGVNDQRTDGWHIKRGELLTASEIYKALANATESQKYELMISKIIPTIPKEGNTPRPLIWGTRFEPIAKEVYTAENEGVKIVDTSCVNHPTVSFLGASPDGIIITEDVNDSRYGCLVEFKCPISRIFNDSTPIPPQYYHQMQLQMECTELNECDYIEMKFLDLNYSDWFTNQSKYKGWFAVHIDDVTVKYHLLNDTRDMVTWKQEECVNNDDWTMVYWVLEIKRSCKVLHETDWLEKNLPSIQSVWNEILKHREAGTVPEHPKEKTILTL